MNSKKKYIFGNWKMYKDFGEIKSFFIHFITLLKNDQLLVRCPNVVYGISPTCIGLDQAIVCSQIKYGIEIIAQDINQNHHGAFTGQVSIEQIKDFSNINYIIIGHSETRKYGNVTDKDVNEKAKIILENGKRPIICVGETLEQYEKKETNDVLESQIKTTFANIALEDALQCIIAYEPLWAIGSGKTPTVKEISETIKHLRSLIQKMYHRDSGQVISIIYGGLVNKQNSSDILNIKNLDGALVGEASLDPQEFYEIIRSWPKLSEWRKFYDQCSRFQKKNFFYDLEQIIKKNKSSK